MDFSSFNEDNFDLKAWINRVLEQSHPDEELQQYMSTLVLKLQLFSVELNNSLDEICSKSMLSVPRCIIDIEKSRKEAEVLKGKLDLFMESLEKTAFNSRTSLQQVSSLDEVKLRIENVLMQLKEAERLVKKVDNIESVFATNDFQKITNELSSISQSCSLLKEVPEFKGVLKQLEGWQYRLEGLSRPHLLRAFNNHEKETALRFVSIFSQIDRKNQLLQYYYKCRKLPLEQLWNSFEKLLEDSHSNCTSDQSSKKEDNPFLKWLPVFYDQCNQFLRNELHWASQVFSKQLFGELGHVPVVASLTVEAFSSFTSSFRKRLDMLIVNSDSKEPNQSMEWQSAIEMTNLVNCYEITENFARNIRHLLASDDALLNEQILQSIFECYLPYQCEYASLEKKQILRQLELVKPTKLSFSETISAIDNSISRVFLVCEGSLSRCIMFTEGIEAESLLNVLSEVLFQFLQHLFLLLQHLRELAHVDESETLLEISRVSSNSNQETKHQTTFSSRSQTFPNLSNSSTLSNDLNSQFDWSFFQGALRLLEIVSRLRNRLNSFERTLRNTLQQRKTRVLTKAELSNSMEINAENESSLCSLYTLGLRKDKERMQRLNAFFHSLDDVAFKLLPVPAHQLTSFASAVHDLVFDSCFNYIRDRLVHIPKLEQWTVESVISPLNLPSFSLSPLPYITQIGEHLLTLPQQLEPFANKDFALSLETPISSVGLRVSEDAVIVDGEANAVLTRNNNSFDSVEEDSTSISRNFSSFQLSSENSNKEENQRTSEPLEEMEETNGFVFQWINSITRGTMGLYMQKIIEIPHLSETGAKQLAADIGYLMNVASALGVSVDPSLELAFKYISVPSDRSEALGKPEGSSEQKIATIITQMRTLQ